MRYSSGVFKSKIVYCFDCSSHGRLNEVVYIHVIYLNETFLV